MPRVTKQVQAETDLLDIWMYTYKEGDRNPAYVEW